MKKGIKIILLLNVKNKAVFFICYNFFYFVFIGRFKGVDSMMIL
jgi:hypothetical protein